MPTVLIEPAGDGDATGILELLRGSGLPTDGLDAHLASALVARDSDALVGCAALEIYDTSALLRSVAVAPAHQSHGVGHQLTRAALALARHRGVRQVFLLTTTAERFFPRFGFAPVARDLVPAAVRQSVEFVSACPASAIVMRALL